MMNAKITKIESTHTNIRTSDMIGFTYQIPEKGADFTIFGKSLTEGKNMRGIFTTEIQEVNFDSSTKTFLFKTRNSTYKLEILDDLTEAQIMKYARL